MNTNPRDEELIFNSARKIACSEARAKYVEQACGGDASLRKRVEVLLNTLSSGALFLESPAFGPPADRQDLDEKPGIEVGRYKLIRKIGEGGFGVVYLAEQSHPIQRNVALKIIKPGMDTREVVARFEAERQVLALMDHPNISKVFDGGATSSGRPYFVMELVEGVPLTTYCDESKRSTRQRLELFITVCNAIQHAHQKGVIHRDIKPSNVLVTVQDGEPLVKVIDFGVSKAIFQQLTEQSGVTQYGQMLGTPQYMSPEQAGASGVDIDTRSDIYSLGVLLYELLTGATPLDPCKLHQNDYKEVQRLIREEDPLKPSVRFSILNEQSASLASLRGSVPKKLGSLLRGELDWVIMKSLDKDRDRRYETANQFAADINNYLRGDAVEACPPSWRYQLKKFSKRNRATILTGAAFASVLLASTIVSTTLYLSKLESEGDAVNAKTVAEQAQRDAVKEAANSRALVNSQRLRIAIGAYNNGNIHQAMELLGDFEYQPGDSTDIARRFLESLCKDQSGEVISIDVSPIQGFAIDPAGEFYVAAEFGNRIVLRSLGANAREQLVIDEETVAGSRIRQLTISADGQWLIAKCRTPSNTGIIAAWEITRDNKAIAMKRVAQQMLHDAVIANVDLHVGTNRIASLDIEGRIKVWQLDTGELVNETRTSFGNKSNICFSHDGRLLATHELRKGEIHLYAALTLEVDSVHHYAGHISSLRFSPTEMALAITGHSGTEIWNLTHPTALQVRRLDWRRSFSCYYSRDGQLLSVYSPDEKAVNVFDAASGKMLSRYRGEMTDGWKNSLAFYDDLQLAGLGDHELNVFDVAKATRGFVRTARQWHAPLGSANHHAKIAYPTEEELICSWDIVAGTKTILGSAENVAPVQAVAYSEDATRIAVARRIGETAPRKHLVEIWDVNRRIVLDQFETEPVWTLHFSPVSSDLLLVVGQMSQLRNLSRVSPSTQTLTDRNTISAAFSDDGSRLLLGGGVPWGEAPDKFSEARLWQIDASNQAVDEQVIPTYRTYSSAFSSDGKLLACVDLNSDSIFLWDLKRGEKHSEIKMSSPRVMSVDFSPGDECMVVSSPAGEITFVDYRKGEEIGTFQVNQSFRHVRFLDHDDRIVASTMDGAILQWAY
ncbi:WD40 repeat domain-containing serine/threonine protein kinase [Novipirellula artificiosorum]|uniref:Serine/threonine-protein kinase PknB n=1 Tax=Novipirellula artificiosorum TaxID=2528016 RepID=A0A5C6DB26_9BACT|nr:WD40 repeat domain-containing serine/threonine protein kinase [Novipirellula artificiosorum]TWU33365.1 Serine/threonine-protein kinase PknB [Novipirellula artificiosorum]